MNAMPDGVSAEPVTQMVAADPAVHRHDQLPNGAAGAAVIRTAGPDDLPAIWRFSADAYLQFRTCSYSDFAAIWRHRWDDNPAMESGLPRGWVLEGARSDVLGFCGLVPIRLKVGARSRTTLCGSNWYIRPEWRTQSLRGFRRYLALAADHVMLSTGLSAVAARVHGCVGGMEPMPVAGTDRGLWWILDSRRFLEWKAQDLLAKGGPVALAARQPALAAALGAALPVALGLVTEPRRGLLRWFARARIAFDCPALEVGPVDRFSGEFDEHWRRYRDRHDVTVERTAAFLDWRHRRLPGFAGECFTLACRERGGRLLGYVSLQRQGYNGRLPGCYVVTDLFYPVEREEVLQNMMNAAFRFVVERDGVVLKLSGFHPAVYAALAGQRPHVIDSRTLHGLAGGGLAGGLLAILGLDGRRPNSGRGRPQNLGSCWFKAPSGELTETLRHGSWWPSGIDGTNNL
jgi:hypothetical protein